MSKNTAPSYSLRSIPSPLALRYNPFNTPTCLTAFLLAAAVSHTSVDPTVHTNLKTKGLIAALTLAIATAGLYIASNSDSLPPLARADEPNTESTPPPTTITPAIDPELLARLKTSYQKPRVSPTRIRLQSALSDLPNSQLPISQFLDEISDRNAPAEYKLFLARTLRNAAKTGLSPQRFAQTIDGLYAVIEQGDAPESFLANLATSLIDTDDSPATIELLTNLLERLDDDRSAAITVNAIARSRQPAALAALYDFALAEAEAASPRTLALAESLIPLSFEQRLPLEPTLLALVSKTQDIQLFSGLLKALSHRPPSETRTQAFTLARERISTFPEEIQPALLNLTQTTLAASTAP